MTRALWPSRAVPTVMGMSPAAHSASPRSARSRVALVVALVLSLLALIPAGPGPAARARLPSVVAAATASAPLAVEQLHRRVGLELRRADGAAGGPDLDAPLLALPPSWELAVRAPGRDAPVPPPAVEVRPRSRPRSHVSARGPPPPGCASLG